MSGSPNKMARFWQELKRRKVFGVATTYAATAYIIIEVTNNLAGPLNLPAWVARMIIILLAAGLPVAVILAWIFDFTLQGIHKTESIEEVDKEPASVKSKGRKLRPSHVLNAILILAVIVLAWPKIFRHNPVEELRSSGERISVAVMPFRNMTNDTTWKIWQEGIQFNMVSSLSSSMELKVKQSELTNSLLQSKGYTNYSLLTPSIAGDISKDLNANVFIYGTINKAGDRIRLNAQLIDSKTEDVFKSFKIDGNPDKVLEISDSLSSLLRSYLVVSLLNKEIDFQFQKGVFTFSLSNSVEASKNFILGYKAFNRYDNLSAIKSFSQAIQIDSAFTIAYFWLAMSYGNQHMFDQAEKWTLKLNRIKDGLPFELKIWVNLLSAKYLERSKTEELKYALELLGIDDQVPSTHWGVGLPYFEMYEYENAIPEFEKTLEIYRNWNTKPMNAYYYEALITSYHKTNNFQKEKELLKKAFADFPDDPGLIRRQAILSLTEGDTVTGNRFMQKYLSSIRENSSSEADIKIEMADIYGTAGNEERAEKLYRQAAGLQPGNLNSMKYLARFLINSGRNPAEGLGLINKVLKSDPDCYICLDAKGWGLYKQGNYKEALKYLQESWDKRPIYNHEIFLHLEAAKKAAEELKK